MFGVDANHSVTYLVRSIVGAEISHGEVVLFINPNYLSL